MTVESGCSSLEFDTNSVDSVVGVSQNTPFALETSIYRWILDPLGGENSFYNVPLSFTQNQGGWVIRSSTDDRWVGVASVNGAWVEVIGGDLVANEYGNVAVTYEEANGSTTITVFVDGQQTASSTASGSITYNGNELLAFGNMFEPGGGFPGLDRQLLGKLGSVRISDVARYTQDFTPSVDWQTDASTVGLWNAGTGSTWSDQSGNGYDGTLDGPSIVDICPEEDLDGDGVAAWEDCDDGDPLTWDSASGVSSACAAISCKTILDDGFAQVGDDGHYWISPYGTSYEVECDMTYDGGGWTILLSEDCSAQYQVGIIIKLLPVVLLGHPWGI